MSACFCEHCGAEINSVAVPAEMCGAIWRISGEQRRASRTMRLIFETLWKRRGRIVARISLLGLLYGMRANPPNDKTLDVHIYLLRQLLDGSDYEIESDYGLGWRLVSRTPDPRCPPERRSDGKEMDG